MVCHRVFIWKVPRNRDIRERQWFKLWVIEGDSIRRLCQLSGYGKNKLERIKDYWLTQMPPAQHTDWSLVKYVVYDATYFPQEGCLLNLMDATTKHILAHCWVKKESFRESYPWFLSLRQQGLEPLFITTDGEQSTLRAMRMVWPQAALQRCLYHIKHEGMRWLRTYPKTDAGKELRGLLSGLCGIKTTVQKEKWTEAYRDWVSRYKDFVLSLPKSTIAYKDLKRTMNLINHALPDMFRYLEDSRVQSTTNSLEGFHSQLKADYQRHRGLNKEHRLQYFHWYCYYKNAG